MKTTLILLMTLLFTTGGCTKEEHKDTKQENYPSCIQTEIDRILDSTPQTPRATIELYSYQNENVYLVDTNFPDDKSNVYNPRCELICSVGGFGGSESNTCVEWENAQHIKTIWTDNR